MINLIYIGAAIEAKTGQRLSFERIRELLVEEGLITQKQADEDAQDFKGYDELFAYDSADTEKDSSQDEGLPDKITPT